jgi:hypothetical protein
LAIILRTPLVFAAIGRYKLKLIFIYFGELIIVPASPGPTEAETPKA